MDLSETKSSMEHPLKATFLCDLWEGLIPCCVEVSRSLLWEIRHIIKAEVFESAASLTRENPIVATFLYVPYQFSERGLIYVGNEPSQADKLKHLLYGVKWLRLLDENPNAKYSLALCNFMASAFLMIPIQ